MIVPLFGGLIVKFTVMYRHWFTEDNDEDVRHGEGDEIVVHGAVQAFAFDYDDDDWEVTK